MLAERRAKGSGTGIRQRPVSISWGASLGGKTLATSSGGTCCTLPPSLNRQRFALSWSGRRAAGDDDGMVAGVDVAPGAGLALDGGGRLGDGGVVPRRGDVPLQGGVVRPRCRDLLLDAVTYPGFGGGGDEQGDTDD